MSNQALFISNPYHLSSKLEQLVLQPKGEESPAITRTAEELLFVELDNPQITFTPGAIQLLLKNRVAILFADAKHLPGGLLLPFEGNTLQAKHQLAQWENHKKLAPKLWKQLIEKKIANQI